jgi:hypothetical protein
MDSEGGEHDCPRGFQCLKDRFSFKCTANQHCYCLLRGSLCVTLRDEDLFATEFDYVASILRIVHIYREEIFKV